MCPLYVEEFEATNIGHYVLCLLQGKAGTSVASPLQDGGRGAEVEPDRHVRDLRGYQPPLFGALYYTLHMQFCLIGSNVLSKSLD